MELFSKVYGPEDAPRVILLHGLFGASDNLSRLAKALSESFRVHALDARNHGRSPHSDRMDYPAMARDVLLYMDQANIEQSALFGHSMGGKTAMELALSMPERISRLIVADIAPVDYAPHHRSIFEAFASVHLAEIKSRSEVEHAFSQFIEDGATRQFLLKSLIREGSSALFRWRFNVEAIVQNYQHIIRAPEAKGPYDKPVLFIAGGHSDYILPEHRDSILRLFPNARSKIIEGVGHWLHAEKPELFNRLCQRFLEES
ncbi:MAG: alpha/beta hydrolase [Oleiphilus sp.]|nr:MAG: alpha/beta hydrolase [Oleiphilus sp.]